ncbi:MAG: hypothetical protein WC690_00365 [bacterium]
MRSIIIAVAVAVIMAASVPAALAKDLPLEGMKAQLHQIIGNEPGTVEVVTPYDRAIKLSKLGKNDVAYWNPDGGKYIMAGDYAYVFCKIYNTKNGATRFDWVAVNSPDLSKAIGLATTIKGGVAFYKLTSDGSKIVMEAITYDAVHAMAQGKAVMDVNE